ncbi:hypothetical protein NC651_021414 [Populus alba x Populus x berolinensis]|nr:hypothetical protein NC651_023651 [Populus alba x Populus x berolinensis]KAJ6904270.1 hypothetical protein NC651_021414 [Populus alba x Populus x berolinensis]
MCFHSGSSHQPDSKDDPQKYP